MDQPFLREYISGICLLLVMQGLHNMGRSRKFRQVEGLKTFIFSNQYIFCGAVRTSVEKQLDPLGPIASRGRSVPASLKKTYNHL